MMDKNGDRKGIWNKGHSMRKENGDGRLEMRDKNRNKELETKDENGDEGGLEQGTWNKK